MRLLTALFTLCLATGAYAAADSPKLPSRDPETVVPLLKKLEGQPEVRQVDAILGHCDRETGSGLCVFIYVLQDKSEIWVSTGDCRHLGFITRKREGQRDEFLFGAKAEPIKRITDTFIAFADVPTQKGERLILRFLDGFKIVDSDQGWQDASKGDVRFAVAKDGEGHEIRAFHASHIPVSNEEIGKFLDATVAFYSQLPGVSVGDGKVETIRGRNWGRVSTKRGERCIVMAFYSMDGSPTRLEFHGSADQEKILHSFVDTVIERFGVPDQKANQPSKPTAPSERGSP